MATEAAQLPLISVVLVTYNRKDVTTYCLDTLYRQSGVRTEIIVIDNDSKPGLQHFLKEEAKSNRIQLTMNPSNYGACHARNQAIRQSQGDYVLFMDADVILPDDDALKRAVETMEADPTIGQLGGVAYSDLGCQIVQHSIMQLRSGFRIRKERQMVVPPLGKVFFDMDYIQSDFALMRRDVFSKVKGLDPFYRYYLEDPDLSFRIAKAGYRLALNPEIRYVHFHISRYRKIDHQTFYKSLYLYQKNKSVGHAFVCLATSMMDGVSEIRQTSALKKKALLVAWHAMTPIFFLWSLLSYFAIQRNKRVDYLQLVDGRPLAMDRPRYSLIRFPLKVEEVALRALSSFLFSIKREISKRNLFLFVTNRCNFTCDHCFLEDETQKNREKLSIEEIATLAESISDTVDQVTFTGGEPLLRRDLPQIYGVFQKMKGIRSININTNGYDPNLLERTVRSALDNDQYGQEYSVTISLDGLEEKHDEVRHWKGSFRKAIESLQRMKKLRQEYPQTRLKLQGQMTITSDNYGEFYSLYRFVTYELGLRLNVNWFRDGMVFGVDSDVMFPPMQTGLTLPPLGICEEVAEFLAEERWYETASNLANGYTLEIAKDKKQFFPCAAPDLNLVIYDTGDVSFCEMTKPVGNLREVGGDVDRLLKSDRWSDLTRKIDKCTCIHPCNLPVNMGSVHYLDLLVAADTRISGDIIASEKSSQNWRYERAGVEERMESKR